MKRDKLHKTKNLKCYCYKFCDNIKLLKKKNIINKNQQ